MHGMLLIKVYDLKWDNVVAIGFNFIKGNTILSLGIYQLINPMLAVLTLAK